jgi:hypothetical protein
MLHRLSVPLVVIAAAVLGCSSKGSTSNESPAAMSDHVALSPPSPPAGPIPIPYPNAIAAPAEQSAASAVAPVPPPNVAAPDQKGASPPDKATGQASGKRQHAPMSVSP